MRISVQYLTTNRHGTFSYRRELPKALRPSFGGKRNIVQSLQTKNSELALQRYAVIHKRVEAEVDAARNGGEIITPIEAHRIASRWLVEALKQDRELRHSADYPADDAAKRDVDRGGMSVYDEKSAAVSSELEWGNYEVVSNEAEAALRLTGVVAPRGTASWIRVCEAVGIAKIKLLATQQARAEGNWTEPNLSLSTSPTLRELFDRWAARKGKDKQKTIDEARRSVDGLTAITGNIPADQITKRQVVEFRDVLAGTLRPASQEKYIRLVQTVIQTGIDDDLIKGPNPASRIKFADDELAADKRHPFSQEHLKVIFGDDIFIRLLLPNSEKSGGPAAFWLPLLFLFSGARPNELAQLRTEDFSEEDGIWSVAINGRVKTAASRRRIPIHEALINIGLKEFVASVGSGDLFPLMTPNKYGNRAQNFSDWFGRFLKAKNLKDEKISFYSFRHSFVEAATAAMIPDTILQRLIGHAAKDTLNKTYRKKFPMKVLKDELDKVAYAGVDLSKIKWSAKAFHVSAPIDKRNVKRVA